MARPTQSLLFRWDTEFVDGLRIVAGPRGLSGFVKRAVEAALLNTDGAVTVANHQRMVSAAASNEEAAMGDAWASVPPRSETFPEGVVALRETVPVVASLPTTPAESTVAVQKTQASLPELVCVDSPGRVFKPQKNSPLRCECGKNMADHK
jgi:hypothetical protein